jgi:hypothetical protein
MKYLLAAFLALPACANAAGYCTREPEIDPELPAGLVGSHELIGKDSASGTTYAGALEISDGKTAYVLTRIVNGSTVKGSAWIERCGPDRFPIILVRYDTGSTPIELACFFGTDGDNYFRVTCKSGVAGREGTPGLEAWFQQH